MCSNPRACACVFFAQCNAPERVSNKARAYAHRSCSCRRFSRPPPLRAVVARCSAVFSASKCACKTDKDALGRTDDSLYAPIYVYITGPLYITYSHTYASDILCTYPRHAASCRKSVAAKHGARHAAAEHRPKFTVHLVPAENPARVVRMYFRCHVGDSRVGVVEYIHHTYKCEWAPPNQNSFGSLPVPT